MMNPQEHRSAFVGLSSFTGTFAQSGLQRTPDNRRGVREERRIPDAIIVSDIHLGADVSQVHAFLAFLTDVREGRLPARQLVLNGDVFDSMDFRRLRKAHWQVLSLIRAMSDEIPIVWVCGNHDGPAEFVSHLLGVEVKDEHVIRSRGEEFLVLHGHTFDDFIDDHPLVTAVADACYRMLQRLDRSHGLARSAKFGSKTFLRCSAKVRDGAVAYAQERGLEHVCCGHTHHAVIEVAGRATYYNSGCWTELPCTYLEVAEGKGVLREYRHANTPSEKPMERAPRERQAYREAPKEPIGAERV
jgi:UDP-2,3-diacylglucosamine pyrophosphatase LpxH